MRGHQAAVGVVTRGLGQVDLVAQAIERVEVVGAELGRDQVLRGRALRENPQLIQLTVAEKLSPGIQTVMLPSDGNFLLDVGNLTGRSAATKP